jgi:hypothetical protein
MSERRPASNRAPGAVARAGPERPADGRDAGRSRLAFSSETPGPPGEAEAEVAVSAVAESGKP